MGEMIEFKRPDGKTCPGYLAAPLITGDQERTNAPGIVVIQEWWGLNDQIKKTGDRFAQAGFRALVPDLFRGKVAKAPDEARHLMTGLNFPDAASRMSAARLQYLKLTPKSGGDRLLHGRRAHYHGRRKSPRDGCRRLLLRHPPAQRRRTQIHQNPANLPFRQQRPPGRPRK